MLVATDKHGQRSPGVIQNFHLMLDLKLDVLGRFDVACAVVDPVALILQPVHVLHFQNAWAIAAAVDLEVKA